VQQRSEDAGERERERERELQGFPSVTCRKETINRSLAFDSLFPLQRILQTRLSEA
jgi:hypothetical protein